MAVIAGAIAALGTIVSAYAAYQSGQQQAKALDYQAKVARNQATAAQQAAQVAAENARERNRRVLASQRARIGASGVIGSEGSSLLVQLESAEQAALEEARIRYGGEVQATGLESAERLRRVEARGSRPGGARGGGGAPTAVPSFERAAKTGLADLELAERDPDRYQSAADRLIQDTADTTMQGLQSADARALVTRRLAALPAAPGIAARQKANTLYRERDAGLRTSTLDARAQLAGLTAIDDLAGFRRHLGAGYAGIAESPPPPPAGEASNGPPSPRRRKPARASPTATGSSASGRPGTWRWTRRAFSNARRNTRGSGWLPRSGTP